MAIESADDLAAMFSTDDFAEAAQFTPAGGAAIAVTVLVDLTEAGGDVNFPSMREGNHAVLVRKSEIAEPALGQFSQIASVPGTYRVTETTLDLTGTVWTCHIASTT